MKANSKKVSLVVICVLAGYVLGSVIGLPISSGVLGAGDISKVSKYQKNLVSPQANAFQEKILSDSTARAKAAASLVFLTSRMQEFSDLVDYAARVSDGKSELSEVVAKLQTVKRISDNAAKAGAEAKEAFVDVVNKEAKNSAAVYETASKNLTLAYLMLDRQIEVGNEYVIAVDSYLAGKKVDDNKELAMARELWVNYLYGSAKLNNNSEKVAYYKEKGSLLSGNEFNAVFSGVDSSLRQAVKFDVFCGVGSENLEQNNDQQFEQNNDNHFEQNNDNHFEQNNDNHFEQNNDNHFEQNNDNHFEQNNDNHFEQNNDYFEQNSEQYNEYFQSMGSEHEVFSSMGIDDQFEQNNDNHFEQNNDNHFEHSGADYINVAED